MTTTAQKIEAVAATAVLGAAGALFGGPVGLAVGLAVGVGVDALILHMKKGPAVMPPPGVVANAMIPGTSALPPGADLVSGKRAATLMAIAGVASGNPQAEVAPAQGALKLFQASVGLPATGSMDSQTRAMLALAIPAIRVPNPSILG